MAKSVNKGNPIHGLEKIPDAELLKISQRELGEWKSYAQELEDKVTELEKKLDEKEEAYKLTEEDKRAVTMKLREDEIWNNTKAQVASLQARIKKVEKTNKEYISRICQLSQGRIDRSKEYLLCAAIRRVEERDCPKVYCEQYRDIYKIEIGWRHPDIMHRFGKEVSRNPNDQGFYTSKGLFVTREERLVIARAAGQVDKIIGGVLTSEDLY